MNMLKERGACNCGVVGCPAWGTVRYRRGEQICNRGCICQRCRNGDNRRRGLKAQREVAKAMRVPLPGMGAGNEETWRGCWRTEVKADEQARRVAMFYLRTGEQSIKHNAIGDTRPFVPIAKVGNKAFAVIPLDEMDNALEAWANR